MPPGKLDRVIEQQAAQPRSLRRPNKLAFLSNACFAILNLARISELSGARLFVNHDLAAPNDGGRISRFGRSYLVVVDQSSSTRDLDAELVLTGPV